MAKIRIATKNLKEFPAEIAQAIKEAGERYGIKSFTYQVKAAPYSLYCAEGVRLQLFRAGESISLEMAAEHTVGASGVRYEVGARVPMQVGTTILEVEYYGGYMLSVTNVSETAIQAA